MPPRRRERLVHMEAGVSKALTPERIGGVAGRVADDAREVLVRFDDHVGHYETAFETS